MSFKRKLRKLRWKILGNPKWTDKTGPTFWFQKILGGKPAQIVQIGSNDGRSNDPLFILFPKNKQWRGLFVEPVSYIFEELINNYPNEPRFNFENAAINEGESLDFYRVDPLAAEKITDLPSYYNQVSSFDKSHIVKTLGKRIKPFIRLEKINGMTFSDLLEKHKISDFDILHIDVEGYDWKVLSQLDLTKNQPTFILFEAVHLSKNELKEAFNFLEKKYELFKHKGDILAVSRTVDEVNLKKIRRKMTRIK